MVSEMIETIAHHWMKWNFISLHFIPYIYRHATWSLIELVASRLIASATVKEISMKATIPNTATPYISLTNRQLAFLIPALTHAGYAPNYH